MPKHCWFFLPLEYLGPAANDDDDLAMPSPQAQQRTMQILNVTTDSHSDDSDGIPEIPVEGLGVYLCTKKREVIERNVWKPISFFSFNYIILHLKKGTNPCKM